MGKTTELFALLKTGNSDAARKLIAKLKKSGEFTGMHISVVLLHFVRQVMKELLTVLASLMPVPCSVWKWSCIGPGLFIPQDCQGVQVPTWNLFNPPQSL